MNYIENNTGNFEQVLWAIELKFLIPFFLIYVSYNTLNYPGFKFRLPCPARLGSPTIKRGTRVSSVVSYHHPWTAAVPWGKPCCSGNWGWHSMARVPCALWCPLPFSPAPFLPLFCRRPADWLLPVPLLGYWSWCLVWPVRNTGGTWASWIVCDTAQWLHITHTPNTHRTCLSHSSADYGPATQVCADPRPSWPARFLGFEEHLLILPRQGPECSSLRTWTIAFIIDLVPKKWCTRTYAIYQSSLSCSRYRIYKVESEGKQWGRMQEQICR